jgi:hypothetical protein
MVKLSMDKIKFTKLKGKDNYRQWKESVRMACMAQAVPYLLEIFKDNTVIGTTMAHDNATNISHTQGVPSPMVEVPTLLTAQQWDQLSEQLVTLLYFHVADLYQPQISSLTPKTLPHLFALFDSQFIPKDTMLLLTKREQLDAFTFKLDKPFADQLVRFDSLFQLYTDAGGKMEENEKIYTLIKSLPLDMKAKVSDILATKPNLDTYLKVREQVLLLHERLAAWGLLPKSVSSSSSSQGSEEYQVLEYMDNSFYTYQPPRYLLTLSA